METTHLFEEPLALYLVWERSDERAAELAKDLFTWLCFDPARPTAHGIGLPSFLYACETPPELPRDAVRAVLILFVNARMVNADVWQAWAEHLPATYAESLTQRLLVVAHDTTYKRLGLGGVRAIVLDPKGGDNAAELRLRVAHVIIRLLDPGKGVLFLSHAKRNERGEFQTGHALAVALKGFVDDTTAEHYFDEVSLPDGGMVETSLGEAIDRATVIAVITDGYAARYWCQWEILRAKRMHRPLVLVDAIECNEPRHFPHAANAPLVRWEPSRKDDRAARRTVINEALRETVRCCQARLVMGALRDGGLIPDDALLFTSPPELATLDPLAWPVARRNPAATCVPKWIVHPDPPLSHPELAAVERVAGLRVYTATQVLAGRKARSLDGLRVAVSISDGPFAPGIDPAHQAAFLVLLTRHLLAAGAALAYGGDQRKSGYTTLLADLARAHVEAGEELPRDAILNTLPWPESLRLSEEDEARLPLGFKVLRGEPPLGADVDPGVFVPPDTVERRIAWTLALSSMRRTVAEITHARIIVGGPLQSSGYFPGLAEEALRHLERGRPVYLVGAYGGLSRVLIDALEGRHPEALTAAFQRCDDVRRGTYDAYRARFADEAITYEELAARFASRGVAKLDNGLSEADNQLLFTTRSAVEQVALILKGLAAKRAALLAPAPIAGT